MASPISSPESNLLPVFNSLRARVLAREYLAGAFIGLGSAAVTEIGAYSGLDWLMIDLEHGMGEHESLVEQLRAMTGSRAASVVRIAANEPARFKRALDMGASGIMIPWVNSAAEARQAVAAMRYPPHGVRGISKSNRATWFGRNWKDYHANSNALITAMIQIETPGAVAEVDAIAATEGVDVLFVGPNDLSHSLGIPDQFDHPLFVDAIARVAEAAQRHGKAAGILAVDPSRLSGYVAQGYTTIAMGSDTAIVAQGFQQLVQRLAESRPRS